MYCKGENHPMFGRTGEKHPNFGKKFPEHSKRMTGKGNPMSGTHRVFSLESIKQMSKSQKKRYQDPEERKKLGRPGETNSLYGKTGEDSSFFGKHHTEETKEILRKRFSGKNSSSYIDGYGRERSNAKHRQLGYTLINNRKHNLVGHHIDNNFVIFIPEYIHKSVWHNVYTGKNMKIINELAFEFYTEQWFKEHNINLEEYV